MAVVSEESATADMSGEGSSLNIACYQCSYTKISKKGLEQHIRMKHRISQVDFLMDLEEEAKEELN